MRTQSLPQTPSLTDPHQKMNDPHLKTLDTPLAQKPKILVVDDDLDLRELITAYLGQNGFDVIAAANGRDMDQILEATDIDLLVLDLMMPGEDGLAICQRLRGEKAPPILMLSARCEDIDRIIGLELGADDYLSKPFHPRELSARIKAILRRAQDPTPPQASSALESFMGWQIDNVKRSLIRPDQVVISLSQAEYELLRLFLDRPGRVLSRDQILAILHGPQIDSFDRAIDVQISRLRRKLYLPHQEKEMITTVRGVGYMFNPN